MVETLDLHDEIGSLGATNVQVPPPKQELSPAPPLKEPEKNINTIKRTPMDSTPINEIMDHSPQDMMAPPMMAPQQAQPVQQLQSQIAPAAPAAVPAMKPKNPFNLTDEQMDAVVAAVSALVAFSGPAQERLGSFVPNFEVDGKRSLTGMVVSALLVAVVYFLMRRFVIKQA